MPYYFGAGEPGWEEWCEAAETEEAVAPTFQYVDPWQAGTTVLAFPKTPGPEPENPDVTASISGGWEAYERRQAALAAHSLWQVSSMAEDLRARGIKKLFAFYDGGNDESFTHLRMVELSDGRTIPDAKKRGFDFEELTDCAAAALMGRFDAGEFILRGAMIIDVDACTITDEKNADLVLNGERPWGY